MPLRAWFERVKGAEGAAFAAAALLLLQDTPLDVSNFYSADTHGFGLFNEYGVRKKNFHALRAFVELLETPHRLPIQGQAPEGVVVAAGTNDERTRVTILMVNHGTDSEKLSIAIQALPWKSGTLRETYLLDAKHDLVGISERQDSDETCQIDLGLDAASVQLVVLKPRDSAS